MSILDRIETGPGTALVLSGGATKAFYFHLGVLNVLKPDKINAIVGSSAGAVLGAMVASGASIEHLTTALYQGKVFVPEFEKWIESLRSTMMFKPRYRSILRQGLYTGFAAVRFFGSLPLIYRGDMLAEFLDRMVDSQNQVSGFFSAIALEELFEELLPSLDFNDLDIDLYVVATDLDNNRRTIFNGQYDLCDDENHFMSDVPVHKAVRASASVPGMFDPVKIKGRYYVDGEVKRTLSADIGAQLADTVIISHTWQPLILPDYRHSISEMGWWNVFKQSMYIVFHERIRVWEHIYQEQNPDKTLIFIRPDPDDEIFFRAPQFSFRPDVLKQIMKSGEMAARHALEAAGAEKPLLRYG